MDSGGNMQKDMDLKKVGFIAFFYLTLVLVPFRAHSGEFDKLFSDMGSINTADFVDMNGKPVSTIQRVRPLFVVSGFNFDSNRYLVPKLGLGAGFSIQDLTLKNKNSIDNGFFSLGALLIVTQDGSDPGNSNSFTPSLAISAGLLGNLIVISQDLPIILTNDWVTRLSLGFSFNDVDVTADKPSN
jgi:hypothetical protein